MELKGFGNGCASENPSGTGISLSPTPYG